MSLPQILLDTKRTGGKFDHCDKGDDDCKEYTCNSEWKNLRKVNKKDGCKQWTIDDLKARHRRDALGNFGDGCGDDCPEDSITARGMLKEIGIDTDIEDGNVVFRYNLQRMFAKYKELAIKKYNGKHMSDEEVIILRLIEEALKKEGFETDPCLIDEIDCNSDK